MYYDKCFIRYSVWSVAVSNNIVPGQPFQVSALSPATEYRLRITAHNEAGSTRGEYLAATLGPLGGTVSPSHVVTHTEQRTPFHQDVKMVVLTGVSVVALVLSFLALLFCLRKCESSTLPTYF